MIQYNHANRKGKHRIFSLKAKSRRDVYQIRCVSNTLLALPAYLPFAMFSFSFVMFSTPYKGFQSQDYIPIILK